MFLPYQYDALNRPVQVTDPLGGTTGIAYDKLRHVLQYHQPNNTSINYNYDVTYDILSVVNKKDSGEIISQYIYQYDPVGNRTSMTDNIGKTIYGYDSIYQLTSVQYPDKPSVSYAYDPVGNRQTMTVGTNSPVNYTYNNANMLQTAGDTNFTYDGNGNMVQQTTGSQATSYVYDTQNHLTQVTLPSGTKSLFGYDYTGMRISDTEPGPNGNPETKIFLWNGLDVVNEDSPYKRESYNVLNGINLSKSILGKNSPNPRTQYYELDGLGSVADTTDPTGNILDSYRYDPYGQTLSGGLSNDNDLQFVGSMGVRNQANAGLIYMRNRWYDPELGVFFSKDPLRVGNIYQYVESVGKTSLNLYEYCESVGKPSLNLYEYAGNDPINQRDPLGTDPLIGVWVGAAYGFITGGLSALASGGTLENTVAAAGIGLVTGAALGLVDPTLGVGTVATCGAAVGAISDIAGQVVGGGRNLYTIDTTSTVVNAVAGGIAGGAGQLALGALGGAEAFAGNVGSAAAAALGGHIGILPSLIAGLLTNPSLSIPSNSDTASSSPDISYDPNNDVQWVTDPSSDPNNDISWITD